MPHHNHKSKVSIITDFYIDFLGSLVPGLFATILVATILGWSSTILCHSISCYFALGTNSSQQIITMTDLATQIVYWKDIGLGTYGNIGLLIVVAYVLGSIFYRQDPKIPDYRSARLVWKTTKSKEDRERLACQPTSARAEDITMYDAQFPYFFLKEYLEGRGLKHLAKIVPWSGKNDKTWKYRTKMFINVLKIRLQFLLPERCKDIIRNEAHVRMATSVWYAMQWVIAASVLALIMNSVTICLCIVGKLINPIPLIVLGFNIFILTVAFLIQRKIEKFLHYLRVREIIYVLETVDFAVRNGFEIHLKDFTQGEAEAIE